MATWKCYFSVTDGGSVYPGLIPDDDQIVSKTYMTRVEGENTRLRHYLARLQMPPARSANARPSYDP